MFGYSVKSISRCLTWCHSLTHRFNSLITLFAINYISWNYY
jgi:hypothetical protein